VLTILKGLVQGISNTIGVQLLSGTFGPVNLALTDPNLFVAPVYLSVQVRHCNRYHSYHNNATPTHALSQAVLIVSRAIWQTLFPVIENGYNFTTYMGVIILWIQAIMASNIALSVTDGLNGS